MFSNKYNNYQNILYMSLILDYVVKNQLNLIKKINLENLHITALNEAILEASIHKHYKIVKYILKTSNNTIDIYYKNNQNQTSVEIMIHNNDKKLHKIFNKYCKLTVRMIDLAAYSSIDFIKYIYPKTNIDHNAKDVHGNNSLNIAICRPNIDIVKFLLKQNYNPNQLNLKQESSFMLAFIKNNFPMVITIYKYSQYDIITSYKDNAERTLLHHAVLVNNVKMTNFLIDVLNVNLNSTDMLGRTALIYSVIYDYDKITEILLRASQIDYYIRDDNDKSVLQYAITNNNQKLIKLLNSYGIYM